MAVLGGSFDPIHKGHLYLAEEARKTFALDRVVLIPANRPPHKLEKALTSSRHRLAMIERAIAPIPWIELDPREIERGGISYTVETVRGVAQANPGEALYFIIGSDTFLELHTWRAIREIAGLVTFITLKRGSAEPPGCTPELASLLGDTHLRSVLLETAPMPVSSTEIRQRLAQGESIGEWVPTAVEAYIQEQGLYRRT